MNIGAQITDSNRTYMTLTLTAVSGIKVGDVILDGAGRFQRVTRADTSRAGTLLAHTGNTAGVLEHPANVFTVVS